MLPEEFEKARPVLELLTKAGFEAVFVGGSVRDALLGRPIHDVDIATSAYPEEVKRVFHAAHKATIDIGVEHGTVLVLWGKAESQHYEVTTYRTESVYTDYRRPDRVEFVGDLRDDLLRRDFTVNALALKEDGQVIDQFEGLVDLSQKRLRAVGVAHARFQEDALRVMRGFRFVASLGFHLEAKTFQAMQENAELLTKISIERIFVEMDKLLLAKGFQEGLQALSDSGAWRYLPGFSHALTSNFSQDFHFQSSAQAWAWVKLELSDLDLKDWKVANDLIQKVEKIVSAYALDDYTSWEVYTLGLEACLAAEDLKKAQGKTAQVEKVNVLDACLAIHHKSEIVVSGKDLMMLGIAAGPEMGQLLKTMEREIVLGHLLNEKGSLLEWVKKQALKNIEEL